MSETQNHGEAPETHLYLIRHGQAYGNVEPIMAGMRGDRGLTELGVTQAERLRDRLAATGEIQADVLIASTLLRAQQTAQIIAPALNLPILSDDSAQEIHLGVGDGMHLEEFKAKYGWVDFDKEPLRPICPGGESWGRFTLRVGEFLTRVAQEHAGKRVVVVCHGGVIDAAFLFFFQMPTLSIPPIGFMTHNTSVTHWERTSQRGRMIWRLVRYNDDTHLCDVGRGQTIDWSSIRPQQPTAEDEPIGPLPTEARDDETSVDH